MKGRSLVVNWELAFLLALQGGDIWLSGSKIRSVCIHFHLKGLGVLTFTGPR